MTRAIWIASTILVATGAAQQPAKKPFQSQASSSIAYRSDKEGEIVEIANVAWQVTGTDIPVRPRNERLVLRTTARERQVLENIGSTPKSPWKPGRWGRTSNRSRYIA